MNWMFMPLKRYAEFSGRSRRMEYWMFQLFLWLAYFAVLALMMMVGGGALMTGDPRAFASIGGAMIAIFGLYFLFMLVMFIPNIAVTIRRLHDTNRSGWWILAPIAGYVVMAIGGMIAASTPDNPGIGGVLAMVGLVAVIGLALTLLVFLFLEGTRGPNKYGPDPKGENLGEVFA